jgi:hypothetical protein
VPPRLENYTFLALRNGTSYSLASEVVAIISGTCLISLLSELVWFCQTHYTHLRQVMASGIQAIEGENAREVVLRLFSYLGVL